MGARAARPHLRLAESARAAATLHCGPHLVKVRRLEVGDTAESGSRLSGPASTRPPRYTAYVERVRHRFNLWRLVVETE
jgi:hypothetical protein